jgi:hypothetical protein
MRLFDLDRIEDESGISGTGIVAQGVEFDDGTITLRWLTDHKSTAVYADEKTLEAIHGHGGKTKVVWRDHANTFDRARTDCVQDGFENCPFASVGGIESRRSMRAPEYISDRWAKSEYLRGYAFQASRSYGPDWQKCDFGWSPALVVGSSEPNGEAPKVPK